MVRLRLLSAEPRADVRELAAGPRDDRRHGLQVHQYAAGEIAAPSAASRVRLAVETDYPWNGRVRVAVVERPDGRVDPGLRVPGWATAATIDWGSGDARMSPRATARSHATRRWRAGDAVDLELADARPDHRARAARSTRSAAASRSNAARSSTAIETADLRRGRGGRGRPPRREASPEPSRAPTSDTT